GGATERMKRGIDARRIALAFVVDLLIRPEEHGDAVQLADGLDLPTGRYSRDGGWRKAAGYRTLAFDERQLEGAIGYQIDLGSSGTGGDRQKSADRSARCHELETVFGLQFRSGAHGKPMSP
ncbi:MAG: hypothetical protein ABL904_07915, partial [Hyphomicrobiaceae bacterium]